MPAEPIPIDDTFRSGILSDHCGFEVMLHVTGTRTSHGSPNSTVDPPHVETHIIRYFATAEATGGTCEFRQAGATVQKVEPDGTAVEQISGHAPVHFNGVMRTTLDGEIILFQSSKESNDSKNLDKICERLRATA